MKCLACSKPLRYMERVIPIEIVRAEDDIEVEVFPTKAGFIHFDHVKEVTRERSRVAS